MVMRYNSITIKILLLVTAAFVFTAVSVLVVVDYKLRSIADTNQEKIYVEKIDVILNTLEGYQRRLEQTLLSDVYVAGFQELAAERLRENYYEDNQQDIFPVLVKNNGEVVLDPILPAGENLFEVTGVFNVKGSEKIGNNYFTKKGQPRWCIYKYFSAWEWYVAYTVPLEVKYAEANELHNTLIIILSAIIAIALLLLILFLTRLTKPIVTLTAISADIASGNLEHNIDVRANDEIGQLADSFNDMRQAIAQQLKQLNSEVFERKQAENNLLVTLNSICDAVISTNKNGEIVHMNPVAINLTGVELAEAVGRPLIEVFNTVNAVTREKCESLVDNVLDCDIVAGIASQTILISKDGTEHYIAESRSPIRNGDDRILGVVLVFRDITEQYKLEAQLRQAEKMQAVGQLAGGVAHDFNNMLGGVLGAAELLESRLDGTEQAAKLHAVIINAAERAAELTQQLLSFSRSEGIASTAVELCAIIVESVALLRRTLDKSIKIIVAQKVNKSTVIGDPAQLQNAIINLCINASHAMPDGGVLKIKTTNVFLDKAYCETSNFNIKAGEYIEVEVQDDGCGIAPENITRIFEPFFTTKDEGKGTGLGLAAVYATVQQHNGAINVYSEVGIGARFNMLLPLSTQEVTPEASKKKFLVRGEGTILVVDDESVMRFTAEAILKDGGYNVLVAENGAEGLDVYKRHAGEIKAVLLDMVMPIMNGKMCFRKLRELNPEVSVILASGFSKEEDVRKMGLMGLAGFITKPYRVEELLRIIAEVVGR